MTIVISLNVVECGYYDLTRSCGPRGVAVAEYVFDTIFFFKNYLYIYN